MEKKTTVEVQIAWIEGLLATKNRIKIDEMPPEKVYPFAQLLGYIESAASLLPTIL